MAGTVSTSSLTLLLIVTTAFSALHLAELGAWLCSPLTASSWSSTIAVLVARVRRQNCQNSHPSIPFLILNYQYPPLSSALPQGCWVMHG